MNPFSNQPLEHENDHDISEEIETSKSSLKTNCMISSTINHEGHPVERVLRVGDRWLKNINLIIPNFSDQNVVYEV